MGLKWDIDHMQKGFYLSPEGEVLEVRNVLDKNGKVDITKIQIGDSIRLVDDFKGYFDYHTSFDDIQLPPDERERDELMEDVLSELSAIKHIDTSYYSNKTLSTGEKKSYFYERKTSLEGTFFFYHNNTQDHPHFHVHLKKGIPLGKEFLKLRKELNIVFEKHNIIPNCEVKVSRNDSGEGKYEIREFQGHKKTLEKISWLYRQAESKVVNPEKSIRDYLNSKKFIYNGIEIYQSNRCYFTLQKDESFTIKREMQRGKNKGKIEEIKVHSLKEVLENYTKFADRAGSRQFVEEFLERVEKIERVRIDREILERYEKIDLSDTKELLLSLGRKIDKAEKISAEYKDFWRENINSENNEKRTAAEGIAEMYAMRQNKIFKYEKTKLLEIYQKYTEKIDNIREVEERTTIILNKFEEYLGKEKVSDTKLCEKVKEDLGIEILYLKKLDGVQYLVSDTDKMDISPVLEKYSQKYDNEFSSTYQVIKYNQLDEVKLDNIGSPELKEISTIFIQKMVKIDKNTVFNNMEGMEVKDLETGICRKINENRTGILEKALESFGEAIKMIYSIIKEVLGIKEFRLNFDDIEKKKLGDIGEKTVKEYKNEKAEIEKAREEREYRDDRENRGRGDR